MNIGEAAKVSGISTKMIRHYETLGIIPKAVRSDAGYRKYSDSDINILKFVKRARGLGFSMKEIKKLVKEAEIQHIQQMEQKIEELQAMTRTLKHLAKSCHGDHRPDCPILDGINE